jgi:hypothetical protein
MDRQILNLDSINNFETLSPNQKNRELFFRECGAKGENVNRAEISDKGTGLVTFTIWLKPNAKGEEMRYNFSWNRGYPCLDRKFITEILSAWHLENIFNSETVRALQE